MKIKATQKYYDLEKKKLIEVDEVLDVTKERAKRLIDIKYCVDPIAPPEEPKEPQTPEESKDE